MSQTYIFNKERDFYTTTASNTVTSEEYKFTSNFLKPGVPRATTLTGPDGNEGTIHWKDHAIEIGGVKHGVEDLQKRQSRFKSTHSRRWALGENQWQSKYVSGSKSWKVWAVHDDKLAATPAVEFTPHRSKTFGKAEAASLQVSVPNADTVFLILVLVYSHLTELPRPSLISGVLNLSWLSQS